MIKTNIKHKVVFIAKDFTYKTTYEFNGYWNDRTYVWTVKQTTKDLYENRDTYEIEGTWKCSEQQLIERINTIAEFEKNTYMSFK